MLPRNTLLNCLFRWLFLVSGRLIRWYLFNTMMPWSSWNAFLPKVFLTERKTQDKNQEKKVEFAAWVRT